MAQQIWQDYHVVAKNIAARAENKIHSDDVARSFGFKGALISGVAVYSYMTRPLAERYGAGWLGEIAAEVKFYKPAYDGDSLTIRVQDSGEPDCVTVTALNQQGETLAAMTAGRTGGAAPLEHTENLKFIEPPAGAERIPVSWEALQVRQPLWSFPWRPSEQDNLEWAGGVSDDLPLYREGAAPPLHPGYVLRAANMTLGNQFILPAWIHVSSRVQTRAVLRAGERIDVHAVPVEKFEKKGNQYAVVNMCMMTGNVAAVEIGHTFIFRVRKAA